MSERGAATPAFNQPGDQTGITNPHLGTLANNGCPPTDQRGVSRPQGTTCDIGSYEKQKKKRHH